MQHVCIQPPLLLYPLKKSANHLISKICNLISIQMQLLYEQLNNFTKTKEHNRDKDVEKLKAGFHYDTAWQGDHVLCSLKTCILG